MNENILLWINQGWAHPWLDIFFSWISAKATFSFPLLALIWLVLGYKFGRNGWLLGFLVILTAALGDAIGNILKHTIQHPRPCLEFYDVIRMPYKDDPRCLSSETGMPSNHALNFFATFCFLSFFIRTKSVIIASLILATLVAISRVYLAQHFPSQVLAGALIGICIGLSLAFFSRYLFKDKLIFRIEK